MRNLHFFVIRNPHKIWHLINLVCNTFSNWCWKCGKMMDIDASWKWSVLLQTVWKCLNSLRELIYFLVAVSILLFRKQLSWIRTPKISMHLLFIRLQSFDTKFKILEKLTVNLAPCGNSAVDVVAYTLVISLHMSFL